MMRSAFERSKWDVREDPQGFSITRDGEDFMGWYVTESDAWAAIQSLEESDGRSLFAHLLANAQRKTPRILK